MHRILLVEDDPTINSLVKKQLSQWGYEVMDVEDFNQVMQVFIDFAPHLVLLDITLPFFNGYYWCQEIRKQSTVPVMFLSSRDQAMDIVMAINMGADDYVAKPFDTNVLLAKIQGILRRSYEFSMDTAELTYHGVSLDTKAMTVSFQNQTLELSKNEFLIFRVLMENQETVISREQLMQALWNSDCFIDDNTLTVNVARLRKRLADLGLDRFIITKKGVGYRLEGSKHGQA